MSRESGFIGSLSGYMGGVSEKEKEAGRKAHLQNCRERDRKRREAREKKLKPHAMVILNITQHETTEDQKESGVVDMPQELKDSFGNPRSFREQFTFKTIPTKKELMSRAEGIAIDARDEFNRRGEPELGRKAMIGGAPYLMPCLEKALLSYEIEPVYAFTLRESVETMREDGKVLIERVFKHKGFVYPNRWVKPWWET